MQTYFNKHPPTLCPRSQQSLPGSLSRGVFRYQFCLVCLCNSLISLNDDNLDMTRRGHVGVNSTVGTISTTTLFGGLVDLDVLDNEIRLIQRFCL
jgi:hypothetical protein